MYLQAICGFATLASPWWSDVTGLFVYAALFGFLSGGYGLIKTTAAELLGRDQYLVALSWMLLFEGVGVCLGPSFAGLLKYCVCILN